MGCCNMNVAVKASESASPVTYNYVTALAMTDKSVSIVQQTDSERTTRTIDFLYSVTITK